MLITSVKYIWLAIIGSVLLNGCTGIGLNKNFEPVIDEVSFPAEGIKKNVQVGDTFSAGEVIVRVVEIIEDSRCPSDVQCVTAGQIRVQLGVRVGNETATLDLSSLKEEVFDGYVFRLLSVEPQPISGVKINRSDYKLEIEILKASSTSDILDQNQTVI